MQKKNTSKSIIKPPAIPSEANGVLDELLLEDEADFGDFVLSSASLIGLQHSNLVIERALFKQTRCNTLILDKSKLADVAMRGCDLSNAQWTNCVFSRIELTDCKLTGIQLGDSAFTDLKVTDCGGELIQMHGSTFKNSMFQNCQLKEADFRFCNLEGVVFRECDLTGAEFYNAKLVGADLRECELAGIKANWEDFRGIIISAEQASMLGKHFAHLLGIDVRDSGGHTAEDSPGL